MTSKIFVRPGVAPVLVSKGKFQITVKWLFLVNSKDYVLSEAD